MKRTFKIAGIVCGVLMILLISLHVWFSTHTARIIEEIVDRQSEGKVSLSSQKITLNYLSGKLTVTNAVFNTRDSAKKDIEYKLIIGHISVHIRSIWQFMMHKELLIDSMMVRRPRIEIKKIRETERIGRSESSISGEMSKIYSSIRKTVDILQVEKFILSDGEFVFTDLMNPTRKPVTISDIYFQIDNFEVLSEKNHRKEKFLMSDNIIFSTRNQDISFPNGRQRLSFSRFRIDVQKRSIEIDSCTIRSLKSDTSKSSLEAKFDTLKLVDVDFRALQENDLIKADSVYCLHPRIDLTVTREKSNKKNSGSSLDKILQQLTGDLNFGYMGMRHADVNVTAIFNGRATTFSSLDDNLEIKGLRIDQGASSPVVVDSFDMSVRNYRSSNSDSSVSFHFDSIRFVNQTIALYNFNVLTNGHKDMTGSRRNYTIPLFELKGLEWDEMLFQRKFKAESAVLHHPVLFYETPRVKSKKRKMTLSGLFASISTYIELKEAAVEDGEIKIDLGRGVTIDLKQFNTAIKSDELIRSKDINEIGGSVNHLDFASGVIRVRDFTLRLQNAQYSGLSQDIRAERIAFSNSKKGIQGTLDGVLLNDLVFDDNADRIHVNGIKWEKGNVRFVKQLTGGNRDSSSDLSFEIRNVLGGNTRFYFNSGKEEISSFIEELAAKNIIKTGPGKLRLEGIAGKGNNVRINSLTDAAGNSRGNSFLLQADKYDIKEDGFSSVEGLKIKQVHLTDSITITVPRTEFHADINSSPDTDLLIQKLHLMDPVVYAVLHTASDAVTGKDVSGNAVTDFSAGIFASEAAASDKDAPVSKKYADGSKMNISEMIISNPSIYAFISDSGRISSFSWISDREHPSSLKINGFSRQGKRFSGKDVWIEGKRFSFTNSRQLVFGIDDRINMEIGNVMHEGNNASSMIKKANASYKTRKPEPGRAEERNEKSGDSADPRSAGLRLHLQNVFMDQTGQQTHWAGDITEAELNRILPLKINNKGRLSVEQVVIRSAHIDSRSLKNISRMAKENADMQLYVNDGKWVSDRNIFQWEKLLVDQGSRRVTINGFAFHPVIPKDSFIEITPWQSDYFSAASESITLNDFDATKFSADSIFTGGILHIRHSAITTFRDKRRPFHSGVIKQLPVNLLKNIPVSFSIDTLSVEDATVSYAEISKKTGQEGMVPVTGINAVFYPVRNFGLHNSDSLNVRAEGYLIDSIWLRLRFRESYVDSLGGFRMTLQMRKSSLQPLNAALIPIASIKLRSGQLDSLTMVAVGREYLAFGKMRMYYHNLEVDFLKDGLELKKGFLNGFITFVANNFVIRRNNKNRTGMVYFPRARDRSVIHYLVKMTTGGMASSIGAKKNKKYLSRYQQELKKEKLPFTGMDD